MWVNLDDTYGYVPYEGTAFEVQRTDSDGTTFMNINVNHGSNPKGEAYAYTLLPGANREETMTYAEDKSIEILSMTNSLHAVKDKETGNIYINAFEAGESLNGLTFYTPCAIIISGNRIYVSDPSWTADYVMIGFENNVSVVSDDDIYADGNVVTVNMPIHGKTYSFEVVDK